MNQKFLLIGILFILAGSFILAAVYNQAPATASAGDTIKMLIFNVTSNSTLGNNFSSIVINNAGNASVGNITNVTVSNGTWVKSNVTLSSFPVTITIGELVPNGITQNYTINFTLSSSATYGVTVQANVTARTIGANLTVDAAPFNSTATRVTESTAPTATATCPSDIYEEESFPCTCTGADSAAADSGVASAIGTSTSPEGISVPFTIGTFTYTCTVTDIAGNSASDTEVYTVFKVSSGAPAIPQPPKNTFSWAKITPGAATIMKNFKSSIGIKQIEITVNNEAQNVKITVTKYDDRPAEVSVEKTGKIYQYLQINTENIDDKLEKANAQFRVEKSWITGNNLQKEDVIVYRYNGMINAWEELTTVYFSEDDTYYYYDVQLNSFSYFAVGEKTEVAEEERIIVVEDKNLGIIIGGIILLVLILALMIGFLKYRKKGNK